MVPNFANVVEIVYSKKNSKQSCNIILLENVPKIKLTVIPVNSEGFGSAVSVSVVSLGRSGSDPSDVVRHCRCRYSCCVDSAILL